MDEKGDELHHEPNDINFTLKTNRTGYMDLAYLNDQIIYIVCLFSTDHTMYNHAVFFPVGSKYTYNNLSF